MSLVDYLGAPVFGAKWQLKGTRTALAQTQQLGLDLPVAKLVDKLFADRVLGAMGS